MNSRGFKGLSVALVALAWTGVRAAAPGPVAARIEALLGQMTVEEKVGQLVQISADDLKKEPAYLDLVRQGRVGSCLNLAYLGVQVDKAGRYHGAPNAAETQGAARSNLFQRTATQESRLHIPLLIAHDVIHGFRTVYPVPLAEAASFDPGLAQADSRMAAVECSSVGIRWTFAPMVDIARDPRWGRIVEGSGEDPCLGSAMAVARVTGFQGEPGTPTSVMACAKHYVAYGAAEAGREYNTADVSERTLREIYLPPFHAAADAHVASFMVAFNEISGVPASSNTHTVRDILRQEWGWNGLIVSDWGSIEQLKDHGVAADSAQAAELAMRATVDMDMVSDAYPQHLAALVQQGVVPQALLDDAVRRVLQQKFDVGLFDNPMVDPAQVDHVLMSPEKVAQARQAARESIVLLKNTGHVLPLHKEVHRIAVIGPLSDSRADMLGSWYAAGRPSDVTTVLQAVRQHVAPGTQVVYARGCTVQGTSRTGFAAAVQAAAASDVAIVVVGESGEMSGEAHSRSSIDVPGVQNDLVAAIRATGKPVVVVLMNGRPLILGSIVDHAPAVVEAWFGGVQAGPAVADVLFGEYNPAGRLPVTFPRSLGQVPIYYNHKNTGRPAISKYDDISNDPLFPFGYGLSYSTFRYAGLAVAPVATAGSPIEVRGTVTNTGTRAGDEVVQLYIHRRLGAATPPVLELKKFSRVHLAAGESRTVLFTLEPRDLTVWDADMHPTEALGAIDVQLGPGSATGLKGSFEVR